MMIKNKHLIIATVCTSLYSTLAIGCDTRYSDTETQNLGALKDLHLAGKSVMNSSYPEDLLHEADVIIGGGDNSSSSLESFASSLREEDLRAQLYTRSISDEDKKVSYALQLLADNKKDRDVWISFYKKAWLINPENSDAAGLIGSSRENFGDFIDLILAYQSRTKQK